MIRALSGSSTRSLHAMARAFAALLLVLHWTAPGVLQTATLRGIFTGDSGLSSGIRAAQPFALPHIVPRSAAIPSASAKPKRDTVTLSGDDKAPLAEIAVPERAYAPQTASSLAAPARSAARRIFDARGPPDSADA